MNKHYVVNRPPLRQSAFVALPLGAVKPRGWLKDQLVVQARGLTGHLDEFWKAKKSIWKGDSAKWERSEDIYSARAVPNFLEGLVPLAYLLENQRLINKSNKYIEWILSSGQADGWFGFPRNSNRGPQVFVARMLTEYHEATGDLRVIPLLSNYFADLLKTPFPGWPKELVRRNSNISYTNKAVRDYYATGSDAINVRLLVQAVRGMENAVFGHWLYNRTGESHILEALESLQARCYDWTAHYLNFPWKKAVGKKVQASLPFAYAGHGVNLAMGLKHPALRYLHWHDKRDAQATWSAIKALDRYHGQICGRYAADEHLSGTRPTQGTELCAVVENMYSMEKLIEIFGRVDLADRLEALCYNALPGTCTPDFWAHQYDQQTNQVLCNEAKRDWISNPDTSNLYGLTPHFMCCLFNMHQGWPRFVTRMWMATHDQGLAAVAYGPCEVKAKVANGQEVTITEDTDYPFDGAITFTVKLSGQATFPLHFRIPSWAQNATITVGKKRIFAQAGTFAVLSRRWKSGDKIKVVFPMNVRTETRYNKAVSIQRGPLYFSLKIEEHCKKLKRHSAKFPAIDWEIKPKTPWNYGLVLDPKNPEEFIAAQPAKRVGKIPWQQKNAPVTLEVKGKALPQWKMVNNSAGDPPQSPVESAEPVTDLQLIPYGCTRLRVTEFPVVKASKS